jgi:tetratricopeptide (TPR) repeat protein
MADEWWTDSEDEARKQLCELLNQAEALFEDGEVGEATSQYRDLVDFVRIRIGPETDADGLIQFLLGRAYHKQQRWARAIECLQESKRIFGTRSIDGCQEGHRVYYHVEALCRDRDNDPEENVRAAVRLYEEYRHRINLDETSPEFLAQLDTLIANLYWNRGDRAESARRFNDILALLAPDEAEHAGMMASVHRTLTGVLGDGSGSTADLERHHREALRLQIADEGSVSARTVLDYDALGGFLLRQERIEEAAEVFREAWELFERLPGREEIAWLLQHSRSWLAVTGRHPNRLEWLEEQVAPGLQESNENRLHEAERLYGRNALEVVDPLRSLLVNEKNPEEKIAIQLRMLEIQRKYFAWEDPDLFLGRVHLVHYFIQARQLSEAEAFLAAAERDFRTSSKYDGRENPQLLELRVWLAEKRDDLELAQDFRRQLEEVVRHLDPTEDAYTVAEYYYRMARFSLHHQNLVEAERLLKIGIRIWVEYLGLNYSAELRDYYSTLAIALRAMNRHEEAAAAEEQGTLVCRREGSVEGA